MNIHARYMNFLASALILCAMHCKLRAMDNTETAESLMSSSNQRNTRFEQTCSSEKTLRAGAIASSLVAGLSVYGTIKYVMADPQTAHAILPPLIIATGSGTLFTGGVLHTMLKLRATTRAPRSGFDNV